MQLWGWGGCFLSPIRVNKQQTGPLEEQVLEGLTTT